MVVKIDFALDIFAGLFSAAAVPNKKQTAVVYRACLEHNANVGEMSMRTRVPRQPVFVLRSVSRLSTAHDAVIVSNSVVLRSSSAGRAGPGLQCLRSARAPDPYLLRCVAQRDVAFALRQSPKPSIGPALAELRRAAVAQKCARLAARLAALAGPGAKR
jgi:hypothetical protein